MTPADLTERLSFRSGYDFLNYGFVGLPIFRVSAEVVIIDGTGISTLDEFLIRGVAMKIDSSDDLSSFLGLPGAVIDLQLAELVRLGFISIRLVGEREKLQLTHQGRDVLATQSVNRPRQAMLDFTYDGLLRTERFYPEATLIRPRDLNQVSVPAIRGVPDTGPDLDDINPANVSQVIQAARTKAKLVPTVLKVLSVRRRTRLYLQAIALVFRSQTSGELHVSFAIDGRLSEEHERQFQQKKAVEKNKLFANFDVADPVEELKKDADAGFAPKLVDRIAKLGRKAGQTTYTAKGQASRPTTLRLKKKSDSRLIRGEKPAVRRLPVTEHHQLLIDAIDGAEARLLIISPWVRRDIVGEIFVERLKLALDRGIEMFIGYGIGANEEWKEIDGDCKRNLERLGAHYPKFRFKRLGDTHAKILLKDNDYFVVSSFNWLSFRGDPNRPFREEWGTMIAVPTEVEVFFQELRSRFD